MSDDTDPKPAKTKPAFSFVDNTTERLVMLHRKMPGKVPPNTPPPTESTAVGRGLGMVRSEYLVEIEDGAMGVHVVDPTKISDGEVARTLQRCTSRQALNEWRKIEKRPRVVEQITARLSSTLAPPKASEDD